MIVARLLVGATIAAAIGVYAWYAFYLYQNQRMLLYGSGATHASAQHTNYALARGGVTLRGWVVHPGAQSALIYFGGNAEAVQYDREQYARWAPNRAIYLVAYRGYGASDGTPSEAALFSDALAIYDDVRAHHRDVAVVGRSLGSGIATWVASARPVERLVLMTPYDSVVNVVQRMFPIFPVHLLLHDKFESWRYAPSVRCPVLILAANDDESIPAASTQRLIDRFAPPPQVVWIPNAGHISLQNDPRFVRSLTAFLR